MEHKCGHHSGGSTTTQTTSGKVGIFLGKDQAIRVWRSNTASQFWFGYNSNLIQPKPTGLYPKRYIGDIMSAASK